ncbi:hypothetical protein PSEHALCIP103_02403 [Pseudoalteromonas haloplanktis]|uniref:Uncharacterized protein n=1 Tax=Pseudoalteromonas haloplanktis TaxID=228 RepID=A0A9W4R0M4_PSEHA|nr:hypothetical protein PSEHALCIP103_02403 [Pseudoalteromonas haloplanktis]
MFEPSQSTALINETKLTVQTSIPEGIAHLLGQAKLTLLAEVAHYQLWFPLQFKTDELGHFSTVLAAPEVIDTKGTQRSWRLSELNIQSQGFCIESISSTGIFLKSTSINSELDELQNMQFILPNEAAISLDIEPVRHSECGIAAKIKHIHHGKEQLRAYLFEVHKREYSSLYQLEHRQELGLSN